MLCGTLTPLLSRLLPPVATDVVEGLVCMGVMDEEEREGGRDGDKRKNQLKEQGDNL